MDSSTCASKDVHTSCSQASSANHVQPRTTRLLSVPRFA